jgi:prolyl 4-hydroxylase
LPKLATTQALELANAGRVLDAVTLLLNAGRAGDSTAFAELAIWHVDGRFLPRDLRAARDHMASAARLGHADGVLMHLAMVANGTGGAADWSSALMLLEAAAATDHIAKAQFDLVAAMRLGRNGAPSVLPDAEIVCADPRITRLPGFLTPGECAHVAATAAELLEPAAVLDPLTGQRLLNAVRTSDSGAIGPLRETLVVRAINQRIAAATGTQVDQGEPLTVLRYAPGQQYRLHHDAIAGASNQRIRTVLVYLNQGFDGGETVFPELSLSVGPTAGDALVFDNLRSDGAPDPRMRHAGLPVRTGVKWLATRWIREGSVDPWSVAAG